MVVTERTKVKPDRRIQRTQKLLHEAFVALLGERPYESIAVRDILERAGVGRSTFYMHFRDKHELLTSGIGQMLDSAYTAASASRSSNGGILGFSLPMFEHIQRHRRTPHVRIGATGWAVVHEQMRKAIAELIAGNLKTLAQQGKTAVRIPSDLLVQHVASTFILVLGWWLERGGRLSAKEVDDLFRALLPRRSVL